MSMRTIFLAVLGVWLPSLVVASDCHYDEDLVAGDQIVTDEEVFQSTWLEVDGDRKSNHYKQLYMTYENGDIVMISHRYCQMYEFEATVMWIERPDPDDADRITKRLAALFNEYSALKSDEEPIAPILLEALSSMPLDSEAPVSKFISEVIDIRALTNVEAMVTVAGYPAYLPGVKYMTTLYVGFGGMP